MTNPINAESEAESNLSVGATSGVLREEEETAAAAAAAAAAQTLRSLERFDKEVMEETGLWIFGYGSLCWNQGFDYEKSVTGFVRGFSRKFWQGNTAHRGTQKKPGRVATLIEEENGTVWGQAFQVKEKEAFSYLNNRECELGGYITTISTFYPRPEDKTTKPFPVILYLATPSNRLWLGDSPLPDIANQIVECTGNSGHNVEYLLRYKHPNAVDAATRPIIFIVRFLANRTIIVIGPMAETADIGEVGSDWWRSLTWSRLATFVRENIPEAVDDHLFTLEFLVRSRIEEKKLCLKTLMGEKKVERSVVRDPVEQQQQPEAAAQRTDFLQFTSTVPSKKLRCVNI